MMASYVHVSIALLVLLALCNADPQIMNLIPFDSSNSDQLALCNDGTTGGFYFSKATDPSQSNVFVVHLPGGGQCYDKVSCDSRSADMKSFSYASPTLAAGGFLDSDPTRTPLWGANKAYLYYCSSDGYMGDAPASNETWGYHFRGQRLVRSMFTALTMSHGFSNATTVYLSGVSAGARGMMTQIDQLVADFVSPAASVVGLLDSPYYLDVEPLSSASQGFQYQEQQKYKYFNTRAVLSTACVTAYPDPAEQWKCQFGEYRMPFVTTPHFLIFDQFDSYQLQELTRASPDQYTPAMVAYSTAFGAYGRSHLQNLSASVGSGAINNVEGQLTHIEDQSQGGEIQTQAQVARILATHDVTTTTTTTATTATTSANNNNGSNQALDGRNPLHKHRSVKQGGFGYYSPACYYHAIASSDLFYKTATNDQVILRDAFAAYLAQQPGWKRKSTAERAHEAENYDGAVKQDARVKKSRGEDSGGGGSQAGTAWSMAWIDTCTSFMCGVNCNGIV